MNNLKVTDLKTIAKAKGLRGYSKLRKAELIALLTREGVRPKGELIFVDEAEPEVVVNQKLEDLVQSFEETEKKEEEERKRKKMSKREVRKAKKKKREAEKRCREIEKEINFAVERKNLVEKRRKKRESKKRNKKSRSAEKLDKKKSASIDIDQLMKEVEEESRVRPKVFDVERAIKRLKKKQRKAKGKKKRSLQKEIDRLRHRSSSFELVESKSALDYFTTLYTIEGREGYDAKSYLLAVKPTIFTFLRENHNIKLQLALKCRMSKKDLKTGEVTYCEPYFLSNVEIVFQNTDLEDLYSKMLDKILESLANFQQSGSGWKFERVEELNIHTVKYEPLKGSSYIPLPKNLTTKKAILNMKNMDNKCFKWCVARALNPVEKNAERITKILHRQAEKLNWEGLNFPVELSQITHFEKLNEISVNVYGYEKGIVYPLRASKAEYSQGVHVNLLLISEDKKKHYCLIKNMSRLLSSQISKKKTIKFYCPRCLNSFGRQDLLDKHLELCKNNEAVGIKMPEEGTFVHFKNHHKKMDMPFVIYADFESLMKAIHSTQQNSKNSYTEKKVLHKPISFCYYVKCFFDDKFSKKIEYTATSEDEDVAQIFVDKLEKEVQSIYKDHPKKTMIFTKKDERQYEKY